MMHGDSVAPGAGSGDVWIGGKPALRVCDTHVCTKATPLPHAGTGFVSTYGGVEINGFAALRLGDFVNEGPHGLNPIVGGCPTVTIGPVAPPVDCWGPTGTPQPPPSDLIPFRWHKGQLGHFKGKVVLGVDIDGPLVRVEGTVTAARLRSEKTTTFDVPLGDIDGDGKAEALRVTTQTKTERALGVSEVAFEAHPVQRRVDKAEVTPVTRPPSTPPRVTTTHEIVET
ncbi:MAG: PAAR domain-containing protein [Deltaproteobacteria bacterium]|nr:PAAR domain-containing protein [Deltaproteobacteria bacterium]